MKTLNYANLGKNLLNLFMHAYETHANISAYAEDPGLYTSMCGEFNKKIYLEKLKLLKKQKNNYYKKISTDQCTYLHTHPHAHRCTTYMSSILKINFIIIKIEKLLKNIK